MSAGWIFRELRPGYKDRQSTVGEFFSSDAIDSLTRALVRESIQNSLDAVIVGSNEPVQVRFRVGATKAKVAMKYFEGGWDHFTARGNGLDAPPPADSDCRFLIVEDFGTTGLTGDVNQWQEKEDIDNPFYFFFRAEGKTGKKTSERGRWGIGKYVFPRSSDLHAFIALTVRNDDNRRMLMGQAILKSHSVGDRYFTPDGDFGCSAANELVIPEENPNRIEQFASDFGSVRGNRTGLSVMIPWVDEDITYDSLLAFVIEDYFFPILRGDLEVVVSEGVKEIKVTSESLDEVLQILGGDIETRLRPTIELSKWARNVAKADHIILHPASREKPKWETTLVPEEQIPTLREDYRAGNRIALTFSLTTRPKKGRPAEDTYFNVYLVNDGIDQGKPIFIRGGIIIPGVKDYPTTGCRSIVLIEDGPLAQLLGDSENPAHTEWQKDSEHFRNNYYFPKMYIEFVTYAVSRFVRTLNESDEQPNNELLQDIFFVPKKPTTIEPKDKSRPRKRNKGAVITPDPKPEPALKRFTLSRIAGGFTITQGAKGSVVPSALRVAVAYDRRRGSPLKKYEPMDFQLEASPIIIETEEAVISDYTGNRMIARPSAPEFKIKVTGFDENRDLFIDVRAKEIDNDSTA